MTNIRHDRGYKWEKEVEKIFKDKNFETKRVAGSTPNGPDVEAENNNTILSIECKSSTTKSAIIPPKQIHDCIDWVKNKDKTKFVIFAFKFSAKLRVGTNKYVSRKKKVYFKKWNMHMIPQKVTCYYDGSCKMDGKDLWLEEFV